MYLSLVNGFYLFLDEDKRSVGLYADPFDISFGDHDVEVHVVSDEAVCYEVVVGLHAEVVEGLQSLADCLGDGGDLCRLVVE